MGRRKKTPLLKRLFPYSPFLRILFVIVVMSTVYIAGYSMYHFTRLKCRKHGLPKRRNTFWKCRKRCRKRKRSGGSFCHREKGKGRSGACQGTGDSLYQVSFSCRYFTDFITVCIALLNEVSYNGGYIILCIAGRIFILTWL